MALNLMSLMKLPIEEPPDGPLVWVEVSVGDAEQWDELESARADEWEAETERLKGELQGLVEPMCDLFRMFDSWDVATLCEGGEMRKRFFAARAALAGKESDK